MKFRLSERANTDVAEIYAYGYNQWGLRSADRYFDGLFVAFDSIGTFPKASREHRDLGDGIRLKVYRSHLILYRIGESGIEILRVVHGHYDWQTEILPNPNN